MLQIVINNLENGKIESEDLEYILQLDDIESITFLYEKSQDTQRKLNENIKLETNIYYLTFMVLMIIVLHVVIEHHSHIKNIILNILKIS